MTERYFQSRSGRRNKLFQVYSGRSNIYKIDQGGEINCFKFNSGRRNIFNIGHDGEIGCFKFIQDGAIFIKLIRVEK